MQASLLACAPCAKPSPHLKASEHHVLALGRPEHAVGLLAGLAADQGHAAYAALKVLPHRIHAEGRAWAVAVQDGEAGPLQACRHTLSSMHASHNLCLLVLCLTLHQLVASDAEQVLCIIRGSSLNCKGPAALAGRQVTSPEGEKGT